MMTGLYLSMTSDVVTVHASDQDVMKHTRDMEIYICMQRNCTSIPPANNL